jgi:hypothetical protein
VQLLAHADDDDDDDDDDDIMSTARISSGSSTL